MSEFIDVRPGYLAAVVTHFEMTVLPPPEAGPDRDDLSLQRAEHPSLDWYRNLFRTVGSRWLWFSRLRLFDDELIAIIHDTKVEIYALYERGRDEPLGMLELDFRDPDNVELAFLGVREDRIGSGVGRYLMARALDRLREINPPRVWVHTCTLDHPDAPRFYERAGFRAFAREVEIMPDPRLDGTLPQDAGPHVPVIG